MLKWLTANGPVTRAERLLVAATLALLLVGLPGPCRVALLDALNLATFPPSGS